MTAYSTHKTEAEAIAACRAIDAAIGYPRIDLDQEGREVMTERYALPIPLVDGRFAIPVTDEIARSAGLIVTPIEIGVTMKRLRDTDPQSAKVSSYIAASRASAAKIEARP